MAYLDETGLSYFWDKIKTWIASASSNLVHRTGDETVDGQKTFEQPILLKFLQNHTAVRVIAADAANRSDELDAIASFSSSNKRLSLIRTDDKDNNGNRKCTLAVVPNNESFGGGSGITVTLLDIDGNAVPCAMAPATLEYEADGTTPRTNGSDIVTRNWIPKDTRIVHTSGYNIITHPNFVHRDVDTDGIAICGGSDYGKGSTLQLKGSGASSNLGSFILTSSDDDENIKSLTGKPNGTLTWNGQSIQTSSDERVKTSLSEVPDAVLDAWEEVNWGQFQYLDAVATKGDSARLHLGLIAQHVMAVFERRGLDACAYGILCHEEHPAVDEEETVVDAEAYTDEEGVEHPAVTHVETRHEDAVDLWMVRYAEAQAMEAACQRRRADRLEARIAALEARLA